MEGSDEGKAKKVEMHFDLGSTVRADAEMTKITSVRKGMGKAKYSTLVTTVPSELCKALGITPGDHLMWTVAKGSHNMIVSRLMSEEVDHTSFMYNMMGMLKKGLKSEKDKKMIELVEKNLKDIGPVKKLSEEEMAKEMNRILEERRAKRKKEEWKDK